MAPRTYRLNKRAKAVEETRRRITDAVVQLHREKGILATTYEDIARRADVAPATVYRHFPTLDHLIPACGARIIEITAPPRPDILQNARTPAERVRALVQGLFAFWQRVEPWLTVGRCEEGKLPALARDMRAQQAAIRALVAVALGDTAGEKDVRLATALTDFYTWKALASAGLTGDAAAIISGIIIEHLGIDNGPAAKEGRSNGRRARNRRRNLPHQQLRPASPG